MTAALRAAAARWAAARGCRDEAVAVLCDGPTTTCSDDMQLLLAAMPTAHLLPEYRAPHDEVDGARLALPLATYAYSESASAHEALLSRLAALVAAGAAPRSDLLGVGWISHKRYLLELARAGLPVVPTALVRGGPSAETAARLDAACMRLEPECEAARADGRCVYVVKPALGSLGDGVELLPGPRCADGRGGGGRGATPPRAAADCTAVDDDADADADDGRVRAGAIGALHRGHEMLVQPFLPAVRRRGELCYVFVHGQLAHAVRKEPRGWGARATTDALGEKEEGGGAPSGLRRHVSSDQPVSRVPADEALVEQSRAALAHAAAACGAQLPFYAARVDWLPSLDGSWRISEVEIGWADLFLHLMSEDEVLAVAAQLRAHLPEPPGSTCG